MKKIFFKAPEYYLIIGTLLAGYSPPFFIHPVYIGFVGVLVLQIIFKNRILGMILGILFFLINLFFLGALLSELHEFTEFNNKAQQLLFVGLGIWMANLVFSTTMIYKYFTDRVKINSLMSFE